jgi:hypothetical protein
MKLVIVQCDKNDAGSCLATVTASATTSWTEGGGVLGHAICMFIKGPQSDGWVQWWFGHTIYRGINLEEAPS